jgi:peptide/nickel transport system substrate-binding protein
VQVNVVPVGELLTKFLGARTYQMALAHLDNGADPDQYSFWHSSQRDYPLNFSSLPRQSFVDKDLEDGRAGPDREARRGSYADLQNLLVDATPALFLYEPHYEYAVSRRFAGIHMKPAIEPTERFQFVTDWFLIA